MIRNTTYYAGALAGVLLAALTGCTGLHKSSPAPIPLLANAPSLLSPPAMPASLPVTEADAPLPDLPSPPAPDAQPTPPPVSVLADASRRRGRRRLRRPETEVAEHTARDAEKPAETERKTAPPDTAQAPATPPPSQPLRVTAPTPSGEMAQTSSIGQLTAGPVQDGAFSRQQAATVISTTEHGVDSLRNLNSDQSRTVLQIRSFLDQAERALHNGDVDGASTLATKAKTLLDELTGAS